MKKQCVKCGKTFKKTQNQSLKTWGNRKYCSRKCALTKHGYTKFGENYKPTYCSWHSMKQRCRDPKHHAYPRYSKLGFCDRWLDFQNFLKDMGERPKGKSLDRIDNTKGYFPENCRWATRKQQQNNMRSNLRFKTIEYNGEEFNRIDKVIELSKEFNIPISIINRRVDGGLSLEDAVSFKSGGSLTYVKMLNKLIKDADLKELTPREGLVIKLRRAGYTLRGVGEEIGLSGERVRQIEFNAIKKLKNKSKNKS